jgi:hypothetical protein
MGDRFNTVNHVAGRLMRRGHVIFSPITHSHTIAQVEELPTTWDFWKDHDEKFLTCCGLMFVLCIEGWDTSVGVTAEIVMARDMGIPIKYINEYCKEVAWEG